MEEQMVKIKHNLKATRDRKKSYENKGKTLGEFKVGKHVFLKVKPKKSSLKLGGRHKSALCVSCVFIEKVCA
jgi:hypothetical protein